MNRGWRVKAAVVIALAAITIAGDAVHAVSEEVRPPAYTSYARRVLPGQTLWEICGSLPYGREDLQDVIDRCRLDNGIKDPGALKPGQVLMIRVKK